MSLVLKKIGQELRPLNPLYHFRKSRRFGQNKPDYPSGRVNPKWMKLVQKRVNYGFSKMIIILWLKTSHTGEIKD
jgi:hypothetical protein